MLHQVNPRCLCPGYPFDSTTAATWQLCWSPAVLLLLLPPPHDDESTHVRLQRLFIVQQQHAAEVATGLGGANHLGVTMFHTCAGLSVKSA
jgi:hypothetical protein